MTLIRPLADQDRPQIESWIAAEPGHPDNTFEFYQQAKTVIYEDEEGPVFAVRYATAIRADMEFNPEASTDRVRAMFQTELPGVAHQAKAQGFGEIVFRSVNQKLVGFLRAFGFKHLPDEFRKVL